MDRRCCYCCSTISSSLFLFKREQPKAPAPVAATSKTAIAVLPFTNLSTDKEQEYFSDGLTEELLNVLAKNPKLQVTSRTSAFSFKGKKTDIKTIAEKLNVTHVLEGSVRKAGNQLRITAQLIEVATDSHLWSQTYDRQMENIFAVQDDIAASVAGALKVTLEGGQTPKAQQTNPEAYNAYLQGRYFFDRRSKEDLEKAIGYYEQALQIDPNYARAWVGLSEVHSRQADSGYVPVDEGYAKARKEVEKALELDPNLAEAHAQMGWIKRNYDWDWTGADAAYKRALELEPANADVVRGAAVLAATLGRFDEAITLDRRAIELDPLRVSSTLQSGSSRLLRRTMGRGGSSVPEGSGTEPAVPGCAHEFWAASILRSPNRKRRLPRCRRSRSRSGADRDWRLPIMPLERRRKQMLRWRSTSKSIRMMRPSRLPRSTPTGARRTKPSSGSSAPTNSATAASPK